MTMPLVRMLVEGWDSVRDFWGDRRDRKARDVLMARRRFGVASSWEELGEHRAVVERVDAIRESGRIEEYEPLFRRVHAADLSLPGGCAVHEGLRRRMLPEPPLDPAGQERHLAPFRDAFARAPSPLMAGLHAEALLDCADAARGAGTVDETSAEQWAGYAEHRGQARLALDACPDHRGDCPVWRRADYRLALDEAPSREAFDQAFERAWALDRNNLNLCADHGILMLPRWVGEGPNDLEVFARRAVSLTEARFGSGAYAFIYSVQAGIGHHEPTDTLCDPALVVRGFEDLIERFPTSQSVLNRYAMTLDWLEDYAAVYPIQRRIRTINPNIWGWSSDEVEEEGVREALDAFLIARSAAVADRLERDEPAP